MSTNTWILITLIAFAAAALMFVPAVLAQRGKNAERAKLLHNGEQAQAEILGYDKEEFLLVRYRFTAKGYSTPIECKKVIGFLDQRFPEGTKVGVRYKRAHPTISILEPYAETQVPWS